MSLCDSHILNWNARNVLCLMCILKLMKKHDTKHHGGEHINNASLFLGHINQTSFASGAKKTKSMLAINREGGIFFL